MIRYYPSFAIKMNLIAEAGAFTLNGAPYSGRYYETFDGKQYAGSNPITGKNQRLQKVQKAPQTPGAISAPSINSTSGNEFLLNGKPYVGPYYQDPVDSNYYTAPNSLSTNSKYTPPNLLQKTPNQVLKGESIVGSDGRSYVKDVNGKYIPYEDAEKQAEEYNNLDKLPQKLEPIASGYTPKSVDTGMKNTFPNAELRRSLFTNLRTNPYFYGQPTSYFPTPIDSDYQNGFITRYFVKRINERGYILEISPQEYSQINDGSTTYDVSFYQTAIIPWKLTGPLNSVRISQYDIREGIINTNKRQVENLEKTFIGIKAFIGDDYSKFSIPTK